MLDRDFFLKILNSLADPVFVKNNKHQWIFLNDAYCDFMGYPREELIGKSDYDFFPKEEADVFWAKDEEAFDTGKEILNEESFTDALGQVKTLHTKKTIYKSPLGEKILVGIIRDVTQMKETHGDLEKTRSFLDSIVENIPNMIFVKEAKELRFVRMNSAGEELVGLSKEELLGKNDYDFFPKSEADFFTAKDRQVLNEKVNIEIKDEPIQTKSKGLRYLRTKKVPILDAKGEPAYLLGISEDITEKKQQGMEREHQIDQIKTMNRLMVDRELKMIELKKEVDVLRRQLGKKTKYFEEGDLSSSIAPVKKSDKP